MAAPEERTKSGPLRTIFGVLDSWHQCIDNMGNISYKHLGDHDDSADQLLYGEDQFRLVDILIGMQHDII